jgi:hypothetical protein
MALGPLFTTRLPASGIAFAFGTLSLRKGG